MFEGLRERLEGAFSRLRSKGKLTEADVEEALREVRRALLEADVNYKVVKEFTSRLKERAVGRAVLDSITPAQQVLAIVYEELISLMGGGTEPLAVASKPPTLYMLVGLQGSGKTSTAVKLAKRLSSGHRPMVVACDLQRPAAVEQLKVLASEAKIPCFAPYTSGDPLRVAEEAISYARDRLVDVIIFDTAGRLHVDEALMDELAKMKGLLSPHEILLVVDAMTGQEAVNVALAFKERLSITGAILTKLDGDARGGAALAIRAATGVPVKLVGIGEHLDDLEVFDAARMAQRILGMGDVAGLVEKIQSTADMGEAERLTKSLKENRFTMEEVLLQIRQLQKLGPLEKVLEMVPLPGKLKQLKGVEVDPKRLKHVEAVILSMTPEERRRPEIIKGSRRRRIAQGSGTSVQLVNQVLKQYEEMKGIWKRLNKGKAKGFKLPKELFQ